MKTHNCSMENKRNIFRYEEIYETIHKNLNKVYVIVTAESILFKDKEFKNGLNNSLSRHAESYQVIESFPNKLRYIIEIDDDKFKLLTDFANQITRDINFLLEPKGLKNGECFVKHHTIWIKLP